jgi:hypothetical protein
VNSDLNPNLERTLESAVVTCWKDLMHGAQAGVIHIEYSFLPIGSLDYLKIWASVTRGHWLLACEYWGSANTFHETGVRFDNGYESEELAHILESVMQHQNSFVLPENLGRQGLLQISAPTVEESAAAAKMIDDALRHLSLPLLKPAAA